MKFAQISLVAQKVFFSFFFLGGGGGAAARPSRYVHTIIIVTVSKKELPPIQSPEKLISSFGICLLSNSITVTLTKCKRVIFGDFLKRYQIKFSIVI